MEPVIDFAVTNFTALSSGAGLAEESNIVLAKTATASSQTWLKSC
jgi:hypothetical protein